MKVPAREVPRPRKQFELMGCRLTVASFALPGYQRNCAVSGSVCSQVPRFATQAPQVVVPVLREASKEPPVCRLSLEMASLELGHMS